MPDADPDAVAKAVAKAIDPADPDAAEKARLLAEILLGGEDGPAFAFAEPPGWFEFAAATGFTGEKKDSEGRRICYQNGKRVACPGGPDAGKAAPHAPAHAPPAGKEKFVGAVVDGAVHANAEKAKYEVAKAVGGVPEEETSDAGQKDKKPYDVKVPAVNGVDQDVEVKSLSVGKKQSLSVHEDALLRKVEHAGRTGNGFHTVAIDDRETYGGGANAGNYSGHRMYYKRGAGRYSLASMHPVRDEAELKALIAAPDDRLPEKARGSLPPPPPLDELRQAAAKAAESRKARDKARKAKNADRLREQARARAEKARAAKAAPAAGE